VVEEEHLLVWQQLCKPTNFESILSCYTIDHHVIGHKLTIKSHLPFVLILSAWLASLYPLSLDPMFWIKSICQLLFLGLSLVSVEQVFGLMEQISFSSDGTLAVLLAY
jgi:hypothetical protein